MSEQATQTTQSDTATQAEGTEPTQLQLADLLLAAQAIQLASQRGAFRAEEFTQLGGMFDRITSFLKDSGVIKPAEPAGESVDKSSAE